MEYNDTLFMVIGMILAVLLLLLAIYGLSLIHI